MMRQRAEIGFDTPPDAAALPAMVQRLGAAYPALCPSELGRSLLDRPIPMLRIGEGRRHVLYVGGHHGMEWLTGLLLLRFAAELCEGSLRDTYEYGISLRYLLRVRTFWIVPILNVDGVAIQIGGVGAGGILGDRLLRMNGGSDDFSHWQANARGVDLNHNYDAGFAAYKKMEGEQGILGGCSTRYSGEHPESEPECAALCSLIRSLPLSVILTLHTQGEEIYTGACGGVRPPRLDSIARAAARLSGYTLCRPEGNAAYGGLTDWATAIMGIPALTLECGRGENPLPITDGMSVYARLRQLFFMLPVL